ncbi:MAG TPA: MFS transporter [Baekduia sp.]|uniref:MFS transporter n=1 Tax=Baekduia sp. TaxID=2600305 RepID=UPI002D7984B0|nr:MFS transporter [Baekduia sp.]HET6507508.1 MFS transporter [Baekduia sp.]
MAATARNRRLLRVGAAYAAFIGVEAGAWVALLVYAYQRGGASAASAIALVQLIPSVALAPWVGSLADRHPAGRVLFGGYVVTALSVTAIAVTVAADGPRVLVYLLAPVLNLTLCVARPAQATLLPAIVRSPEELAASNAGQGWLESISNLVVPLLVGLMLAIDGPALALAGMAALATLAALLVAGIPGAPPFAGGDPGDADGLVAGLRSIASQPAALTLVLVLGSQYILYGALDLIFVVLAMDLGMGSGGAGYLTAAMGAGGVLAIVATAGLVGTRRLTPALMAGGALAISPLIVLGLHATSISALTLILISGLGRSLFDVSGRTLLQRTVRPTLLASAFAALEALLNAGLATGFVLAPVLIAVGGAPLALIGTGAILLAMLLAMSRRLRSLDASANVPVTEIHLLRSIDLFAALPAPTLETLARSLTRLRVAAGTVVMRQGDIGEQYYVIAGGKLDVLRDGKRIVTRPRGEGVGEIALIQDTPRTATVSARTDAELYALDRESFLLAVTGHVSARASADELVRRRLDEMRRAHENVEESEGSGFGSRPRVEPRAERDPG